MKKSLILVLGVLLLSLPVTYTVAQEANPLTKVEVQPKAVVASKTTKIVPKAEVVTKTLALATAEAPKAETVPESKVLVDTGISWGKVLIRNALELVFTIFGLLASIFITVLMKKYGFESYTKKLNELLAQGIGFAEQKSSSALKLAGKPLGGAAKLDIAISFIKTKAKEYKLPEKGKEWWADKVEGWLGVKKIA